MSKVYKDNVLEARSRLYSREGEIYVLIEGTNIFYLLPKQKRLKEKISEINKEYQLKDPKFRRRDRIKIWRGGREIYVDVFGLEEKIAIEMLEKIENVLNAEWKENC